MERESNDGNKLNTEGVGMVAGGAPVVLGSVLRIEEEEGTSSAVAYTSEEQQQKPVGVGMVAGGAPVVLGSVLRIDEEEEGTSSAIAYTSEEQQQGEEEKPVGVGMGAGGALVVLGPVLRIDDEEEGTSSAIAYTSEEQQQQQQQGEEEEKPVGVGMGAGGAPVVLGSVLRIDDEEEEEEEGTSSAVVYTSEEDGEDKQQQQQEGEFVPPTDELRDRIIRQVEFYFSDANILKDAFLLKHIRRNRQGYVNIKLISSFRRVKSLTKDYRVVAHSLRHSDRVLVNEEGTKMGRRDPLPDHDETTPSRSVLAANLPLESPGIENVAELFSKCGEIVLIRILRPGSQIHQDIRRYASKHPEIGTTTCAVIEFEDHESARRACRTMADVEDWRKGMRVVPLAAAKKKKDKKREEWHKENDWDSDKKKRQKAWRRKKEQQLDGLSQDNESSCSDADGSAKTLSPQALDPNRLSPRTSPRMQRRRAPPKKSPLAEISPGGSPRSSPESLRKKYNSSGDSAPPSPWVQRRLKAAQAQAGASPLAQELSPRTSPLMGRRLNGGISGIAPRMLDMEGVVRLPKGPSDNISGFYGGVGRGKLRSSSVL